MKKTYLFALLCALLTLGSNVVWGDVAAVGDILWAETFEHFGTQTPSVAGKGYGTTTFDNANITYEQSSPNTKGYNEKLAGGVAPELLLAKSNTTWTIKGIPTGESTEMALTFLSNRTTFTLTTSSADLAISGKQTSWTIKVKDGKTSPTTFDLVLKNTGSNNARIDNVELKVVVAGEPSTQKTTVLVRQVQT